MPEQVKKRHSWMMMMMMMMMMMKINNVLSTLLPLFYLFDSFFISSKPKVFESPQVFLSQYVAKMLKVSHIRSL
jgi:hypothetical protein